MEVAQNYSMLKQQTRNDSVLYWFNCFSDYASELQALRDEHLFLWIFPLFIVFSWMEMFRENWEYGNYK